MTDLLTHLLTVLQIAPKNISLGGDSAGGNLALELTSHILHPHPDVPPVELKGAKLNGLVLLTPWISFHHDWPSSRDNKYKDILPGRVLDEWSTTWLGGAKPDGYNEPLSLPDGDAWWDGLPGVFREVQVVAGGDEILLDSIRELAKRLQVSLAILSCLNPRISDF